MDIDPAYAEALRRGYKVDPAIARIWSNTSAYSRYFVRRHELLWFIDPSTKVERLCVPRTMVRDIFEEYHDAMNHLDYHRAYHLINDSYYIRALAKALREYIAHCPKCLTHQTL